MASIAFCSSGLIRRSILTNFSIFASPGVHWMRDPRSRVYNFSPLLEEIPKVTDFDFDRLPSFVKSSRDEVCIFRDVLLLHTSPGSLVIGSIRAASVCRFNIISVGYSQSDLLSRIW